MMDTNNKNAAAAGLPAELTLRRALERIARWHGEFPATGQRWESGEPMSYSAAYGSNGERDYMRQVALDALAAAPALPADPVDESQPDAEGWKKNTGKQPVADDVAVEVEYRNGAIAGRNRIFHAGAFTWGFAPEDRSDWDRNRDILRWRLAPAMEAQSHA